MIARYHDWRVAGDSLLAPDGMVIAPTLEAAAAAMRTMGWFDPDGSAILWHQFTQDEPPAIRTYPNAFAVRRWFTTAPESKA